MAGRNKPIPQNVVHLNGREFSVVELDKARRRVITEAAKERYLTLIEEGLDSSEAAAELGLTGSRMRKVAKDNPEFAERVEKAKVKARPQFEDRVRRTIIERALDPDGPPALLTNVATVYLPEFREVYGKMRVEGDLGLRAIPTIDAARLSEEELETVKTLLDKGRAIGDGS